MASTTGGAVTIRLAVRDADKVRSALKAIGVDGKKALDQLDEATGKPNKALLALSDVFDDLKGRASGLAGSLGPLGTVLSRLGGGGALLAAGIGAAAGALISTVGSLADLNREAQRAGVGVEVFQELQYAATAAGVPVDAMVDGFRELQIRADEYIATGQGSAAESFKRLGLSAQDVTRLLNDPIDLLDEIVTRTQKLDRAAQIRVFDEMFGGTGGERMVALLDQAAGSLRKNVDEAHALGVIIDGDLAKKAAKIDAQWNIIALTISTKVKKAVMDVIGAIDEMWERLANPDLSGLSDKQLRDDIETARKALANSEMFGGALSENVQQQLDRMLAEWTRRGFPQPEAGSGPTEITSTKPAGTARSFSGGDPYAFLRTFQKPTDPAYEVDRLSSGVAKAAADALASLPAELADKLRINEGFRTAQDQAVMYDNRGSNPNPVAPPGTSMHERGSAIDIGGLGGLSQEELDQVIAAFKAQGLVRPYANDPPHFMLQDAAQDEASKQFIEQRKTSEAAAEAVRKVEQALADELAVVNLNARETEIYNRLKEAGISLDSARGQKIAELVNLLYDQKEAQDAAKKSAEQQQETTQEALDLQRGMFGDIAHGLKQASEDGLTFREVLDVLLDALNRLADRLLDMTLDQLFAPQAQGGAGFNFMSLFSGLGSLFGGSGGSTVPLPLPKPAIVAHGGGVVGMGGLGSRSITADFLAGAPRMHGGGLSGGERAAILMEGEGVFTRSQMRALGLLARGGGGDGIGKVEIYDQRSGGQLETEERRGPNGERQLRAVIRDEIGRGLRRGGQIDTVMRDRGLGERPARR